MLADLIREFCARPENSFELLENYPASTLHGDKVTTLGIVVKPDRNTFDVLERLARFLESKKADDSVLAELEGADVAYKDADSPETDAIIYFPFIKDYPG